MLGCQDFCGYYDWSFHYVRRRLGQAAVELLWREAIGGDSQQHYSDPAAEIGPAGALRDLGRTPARTNIATGPSRSTRRKTSCAGTCANAPARAS